MKFITALVILLSLASSQAQGPITERNDVKGLTEGEPEINKVVSADKEVDPSTKNSVDSNLEALQAIIQIQQGMKRLRVASPELFTTLCSQPNQIGDEDGAEPSGWLPNFLTDFKPYIVPDPDAEMPEDWDAEMDGDWEPPMISNPIDEGKLGRSLRAELHFMFYSFKGSRYSWIWQTVFVMMFAMTFCIICFLNYIIIVEAIVNPSNFNSIITIMVTCWCTYNLILSL